ncbi:hypothetical protein HDV00_004137 [Rhizophlyctis rosea]|nr:hypothetical protein HDV00_004137 [Rhizophlyctis rosea]
MAVLAFPTLSTGVLAALVALLCAATIIILNIVVVVSQLILFGRRRSALEWNALAAAIHKSPLSMLMAGASPIAVARHSEHRSRPVRGLMILLGVLLIFSTALAPIAQLGLEPCDYSVTEEMDLSTNFTTRPIISSAMNFQDSTWTVKQARPACTMCPGRNHTILDYVDRDYWNRTAPLLGPVHLRYLDHLYTLHNGSALNDETYLVYSGVKEIVEHKPSDGGYDYINGMAISRAEGWISLEPLPIPDVENLPAGETQDITQDTLVLGTDAKCLDTGMRIKVVGTNKIDRVTSSPVTLDSLSIDLKEETLYFRPELAQFNLSLTDADFQYSPEDNSIPWGEPTADWKINITKRAEHQAFAAVLYASQLYNITTPSLKAWDGPVLRGGASLILNSSTTTLYTHKEFVVEAMNPAIFNVGSRRPDINLMTYHEICQGYPNGNHFRYNQTYPGIACQLIILPIPRKAMSGTHKVMSCAMAPYVQERRITAILQRGNVSYESVPTNRPLIRWSENYVTVGDSLWGVQRTGLGYDNLDIPDWVKYVTGPKAYTLPISALDILEAETTFEIKDGQTTGIALAVAQFMMGAGSFLTSSETLPLWELGGGTNRYLQNMWRSINNVSLHTPEGYDYAGRELMEPEQIMKQHWVENMINLVTLDPSLVANNGTVRGLGERTRKVPCFRLEFATQVLIVLLISTVVLFVVIGRWATDVAVRDDGDGSGDEEGNDKGDVSLGAFLRMPHYVELGRAVVAGVKGRATVDPDGNWSREEGKRMLVLRKDDAPGENAGREASVGLDVPSVVVHTHAKDSRKDI